MFKLLDVKTYLNKWSVQSDKRIWQNNVSLFINEYLSYKRKRFAFVGIICWISKFSPGKKQPHVDLSFGLQFMIEIIHD